MKQKLFKTILFCTAFVMLPFFAFSKVKNSENFSFKPDYNFSFYFEKSKITSPETETLFLPEYYKILDVKTDKVLHLTPTEYITGVVSAEMPASFHEEALKAQAVAAHSYALHLMGRELEAPSEDLKGAFLSTDSAKFQAYLSEAERKERFGENFKVYEEKINSAVSGVITEILTFNDEPVIAAFHSISSGKTESAKDIWGESVAYLVRVDSTYDLENSKSVKKSVFSKSEVKEILNSDSEIKIISRSDSGTVLKASVGEKTLTGAEIRNLFSLPSANFEVTEEKNSVIFTSYGYGHGVGMSQYGADYMAKNGKTYKEILSHYYPKTVLTPLKQL